MAAQFGELGGVEYRGGGARGQGDLVLAGTRQVVQTHQDAAQGATGTHPAEGAGVHVELFGQGPGVGHVAGTHQDHPGIEGVGHLGIELGGVGAVAGGNETLHHQ